MKRSRGNEQSPAPSGDNLSFQERQALLSVVGGKAETLERKRDRRRLLALLHWTRTRRPDAKPQREPYGEGLPPVIQL